MGHTRIVLGRQHNRVNGDRFAVFIAQGDLAFCVWAQPGQGAALAQFCLPLHHAVRVVNGRWHEHIGFVGRVAKHQALIAGTLLLVIAFVNAHGDVVRLFTNSVQHRTGSTVEAHIGAVVADVEDDIANHVFEVHIS